MTNALLQTSFILFNCLHTAFTNYTIGLGQVCSTVGQVQFSGFQQANKVHFKKAILVIAIMIVYSIVVEGHSVIAS